jgi:hypothetical protein
MTDQTIETEEQKIVIAVMEGEPTLRQRLITEGTPFLAPENDRDPITQITGEMGFRTRELAICNQ